jgi:sugar O-acyltransferase (sialic acid O-acetyltransferase NeuD family)
VTTPVILLGFGGNVVDLLDMVDDLNDAGAPPPDHAGLAGVTGAPPYEVLGYLIDRDELQGQTVHGRPVLGRLADASRLAAQHPAARFTTWIGGVDSYQRRPQVVGGLGVPAQRFVTLVHPTVSLSRRARVGRGVLIYPHCTVSSNVVIEDHAVILPHVAVAHDAVVGEYAAVTSGVTVGSSARIGRASYLGTACCMLPGVRIGEGSLVGIGGVVLRDVDPYTVVVGNPARRLRDATRPD